jgi:hypothetical protein
MPTLKNFLQTGTGWLKDIVDFGVALVLVFVVIDLLFPGTTKVLDNISELVGGLAKEGVAGLVALLLFLLIYKR